MNDLLVALLTGIVAYLIGGIPFGYLIARARGVDLFTQGSGNIGATNVARVLGKKLGILAFVLDFAKGALPVLAALSLGPQFTEVLTGEELGVVGGLCAVLGHLFPVYLRFRGGKGVATAAGVVAVLLPLEALAGLLVWVGIVCAMRTVSAGSLAAAAALCAVRLVRAPEPFGRAHLVLTLFCFVAAALVFVRHRANIGRLLSGNENRLPEGGMMFHVAKVVHVLALGLWFGMAVFFSFVVGLTLFSAMDDLTGDKLKHPWFEQTRFTSESEEIKPHKEYGSRIFGQAISPMFDWYFLLQGLCGFLSVATAWSWQYLQPASRLHRLRVTLLLLATATVVLGWPLERHVSELRHVRHDKMQAYFAATATAGMSNEVVASRAVEAIDARREFGLYHTYSLFLNFTTIGLVTGGMALAAFLPAGTFDRSLPERKD